MKSSLLPQLSMDAEAQKRQVAAHFSSLSTIYHQKNYEDPPARGQYPDILVRHRRILEMVAHETGRMLDVGCGSGRLLRDLQQQGFQVVGVDYSASMIGATRSLFLDRDFPRVPPLAVGDIEHLAFRDGAFDLVVAAGVVEYLARDERALGELRRILRPRGVAVISVRNRFNLSRPLILLRDLLLPVPAIGTLVRGAHASIRALRRRPASPPGLPVRAHGPRAFRRLLERHGFDVEDTAFYHFAICPHVLRRLCPRLCIRIGMLLEGLARSVLGYLATGYLVKARLRTPSPARQPGAGGRGPWLS